MTLTLAQTQTLDFGALFAALSRETQVTLGALAVQTEFLSLLETDAGIHADRDDQGRAEALREKVADRLRQAIWDAYPVLLPVEHDAPYPLWQVLDGREPPSTVTVRGLVGDRPLCKVDGEWSVPDGNRLVPLGGAVNLNSRKDGAPTQWLFWTAADVNAERLRLHPELAIPSECHTREELDALAA